MPLRRGAHRRLGGHWRRSRACRARVAGGQPRARPQAVSCALERVRDKLRASDTPLVVARSDGGVIGMTLAEQARRGDGAGAIRSGAGHVSMVFVDPLEQGAGVGRALLAGLHRGAEARGWVELAVWTRRANARAQRLYRSAGYRPTGRIRELPTGEAILQLRLTRTPSQVHSITLLMPSKQRNS